MRAGTRDRLLRLERAMWRVRWFGVVLGIYLIASYVPNPGTPMPPSASALAAAGLGVLFLVNVVVGVVIRREPDAAALQRLGTAAFAADLAGVWTIIWAYNFEQYGTTWVVFVVLCLEGALRAQLRGALLPVLVAIPVETAREIARTTTFAHFHDFGVGGALSSLAFRLGLYFMVAAVAGGMARNLERERTAAEERAEQLRVLADRESEARREANALQQVILAGVSAHDIDETFESMLQAVAEELGYEHIAVLMRNPDDSLDLLAHRGYPDVGVGAHVPPGRGIAGSVALTGEPEVVPDVHRDPRYFKVHEGTRSQLTIPIKAGEEVIGVLNVESESIAAFTDEDRARVSRLASQMGLVIQNARLLAAERDTVERLRELDAMKSDFIAIASHELRTPLTAVQGSIKTLRRPGKSFSPKEFDELLAILDRQSDRLGRLVEDLLIASRIDAGRVQLRMDRIDVGEMMAETVRELGPRAERVSLAVAPTLPRIITDGQRIGQIVRNLVENALKFSPDGSPVRVTAHHSIEGLQIEVADDGPGIPSEELSQIFDRFHQVGGSLRRRADGFGLGLYIAKQLAEALGGSIDVESSPDRGTMFRVRIPVVAAEAGSIEIA